MMTFFKYSIWKIGYRIKIQIKKEYNKKPTLKCLGNANSDKEFYLINNIGVQEGIFSICRSVLSGISYAVENKMIPVIDISDPNNQYYMGVGNVWEYFFEQPCGYGVKDAEISQFVYEGERPRKYGIDVIFHIK